MEKSKNNQSVYEEPLLEVVHLTEKDIITTSGDPIDDCEGEIIPVKVDNLFR